MFDNIRIERTDSRGSLRGEKIGILNFLKKSRGWGQWVPLPMWRKNMLLAKIVCFEKPNGVFLNITKGVKLLLGLLVVVL